MNAGGVSWANFAHSAQKVVAMATFLERLENACQVDHLHHNNPENEVGIFPVDLRSRMVSKRTVKNE